MIERPLELITLADIEALVTHGRSEGATLDFKETFPAPDHRGVRDFLADVTAFANGDGGDIVLGVREDGNGVAEAVVGIGRAGLDEGVLRVEDQLRSNVDPRVPLFRIHEVPIDDESVVLVMRVGASLIAPHRVTHDRSSRFYRRANRGNYEMSTAEIRQAFAASNDLPGQIRDLHRRAVAAIDGTDMPARIKDEPTLVLTVAPLSVLREARDVRITRENAVLPPDPIGGIEWVVGLDGLIVLIGVEREGRAATAWSINNRRGYVDFAWIVGRRYEDERNAWPKYVVDHVPGAARSAVTLLRTLGIAGPWIAMATVVGARGYRLWVGDRHQTAPAWQDRAYLGEVIDDQMGEEALRPIVDAFWRLFGVDEPPRPLR